MSDPPVLVAVVCRACGGTGIVHAQVAVREPAPMRDLLELDDLADTDPAPPLEGEDP